MGQTRRKFFRNGAVVAGGFALNRILSGSAVARAMAQGNGPVAGPFQPTDESLKQYRCPEWFRDAKFGIWAVWGPESVPQQGDWYARNMYIEGSPQNRFHVANYGHPSEVGFKDIIPKWKAENWEPDKLMERYKKAGAKYFCMIAMHHDNFDCFNSKDRRWNVTKTGPKRDIAAEWKKAAKKHGLKFGMTEHLAASWWFYGTAKGADKTGPKAGVPYDGTNAEYADLYWKGNEKVDGYYYVPNAPDFVKKAWFDRISNMIETYHPDLLYSDSPLPYPDDYGRQLLCNLYNASAKANNGKPEVIYNCKQDPDGKWIRDLERGVKDNIHPEPWQTDTCVGDWYYRKSLADDHKYKDTASLIHLLTDIVSKNGNLLLNFPVRPDGTLDDDEIKILDELAAWMPVNGEAIFGTRPWKVYGEGPSTTEAPQKGQFGGDADTRSKPYAAKDIRFTKKGDILYAVALGWPDDNITSITSLTKATGTVSKVTLLGHRGKLDWKQTEEALVITMPDAKPCNYAYAFKIEGLKIG
jgi:alpha-L-fucosidase